MSGSLHPPPSEVKATEEHTPSTEAVNFVRKRQRLLAKLQEEKKAQAQGTPLTAPGGGPVHPLSSSSKSSGDASIAREAKARLLQARLALAKAELEVAQAAAMDG